MSFANAVCPPHTWDAFSTGFMSQIKPQVEFKINLKCVEPSGSRGYSLRMETRSVQRQIKDALKEKKLTQSKLAELCKVSDNAVSKWVLRPFSRSSRTRTRIRSSAGGIDLMKEISTEERTGLQILALQAVVRALVANHPNPQSLEVVCNQLVGQMQATPYMMASPGASEAFKACMKSLLSPPALHHT